MDPEEDVKRALLCFDQDGSGYATTEYLKYILTSIGDVMSPQEVDQMLAECDTDRDGRVYIITFVHATTCPTPTCQPTLAVTITCEYTAEVPTSILLIHENALLCAILLRTTSVETPTSALTGQSSDIFPIPTTSFPRYYF